MMFLKYEVRLQILGPTKEYPRAIYNILSMESTDSQNDLFNFTTEDWITPDFPTSFYYLTNEICTFLIVN